jgi:tRNA(adenine34) deaminase
MNTNQTHSIWMNLAIVEAKRAQYLGEVPVGCVIIHSQTQELISVAHNEKESLLDPTAHAEILGIRRACKKIGSWRLNECTAYVTLEPCFMCAAAFVQARVGKLVFGALDPKGGAVQSLANILSHPKLNHTCGVLGGVLEAESGTLLKEFFKKKRAKI